MPTLVAGIQVFSCRPLGDGDRRNKCAPLRLGRSAGRRAKLAGDAPRLPQQGCFSTVLGQAMAGDDRDPAGLYFGTNSGSVFGSIDEARLGRRSRVICRRFLRSRRWSWDR